MPVCLYCGSKWRGRKPSPRQIAELSIPRDAAGAVWRMPSRQFRSGCSAMTQVLGKDQEDIPGGWNLGPTSKNSYNMDRKLAVSKQHTCSLTSNFCSAVNSLQGGKYSFTKRCVGKACSSSNGNGQQLEEATVLSTVGSINKFWLSATSWCYWRTSLRTLLPKYIDDQVSYIKYVAIA